MDLKVCNIEIRFTRRNYENILQKAQVLDLMLKNSKIHPRLAFEHCGLFVDSDLAYTLSAEYAEEQEKKAQELLEKQNTERRMKPMTPTLTKEMVQQVETLLKHGSRVEVLIEQGKVTIVEIKRKMRMKE